MATARACVPERVQACNGPWPLHDAAASRAVEQAALVGERPEVFEVQFTAGGFGWVVVKLEGVDRAELAELTFEAWRLSAPVQLAAARGERLPG